MRDRERTNKKTKLKKLTNKNNIRFYLIFYFLISLHLYDDRKNVEYPLDISAYHDHNHDDDDRQIAVPEQNHPNTISGNRN